ncbi:MAG: putative metal-binding motif-containing protein [Nannocystaceae bacterium]|nr:putative metal-binding motif-containing protein [Nannocystaceae bacterium]
MARFGIVGAAFVAAVFVLGGCGDEDVVTPFGDGTGSTSAGDGTGGPIEVEDSTGADSTGAESEGGQGGAPGDPCLDADDCADWCWDVGDDGVGVCVGPCVGTCPSGTICEDVTIDETSVQACIPAPETFCDSCRTSSDCGGPSDLCVALDGGRFCTVGCGADPSVCPVGFGCGLIGEVGDGEALMQCVPDNGICCIDADGDIYGEGGGCFDSDCDDSNAAVHAQADEVCDGFDNDCDGEIDNEVIDCAAGECSLGAFGYFEQPLEVCVAGECTAEPTELCDLYTCADGEEQGDTCATNCDGEDDNKCVPPAHCDDSVCESDFSAGLACDETSDCESEHCQNDFCCAFGDCCAMASDCPTFGTQDAICTSPTTCQGTVGETVCSPSFTCSNTGIGEDDSACLETTVANECGPYPAITCTGDADQQAPDCATACDNDTECDEDAHCDATTSTCEPDVNDGNDCDSDTWCVSGHCQNDFCCEDGDCCAAESDCPASYSSDAVCTSSATCQGERDVAVCNANSCDTTLGVADDSACAAGLVASTCGPYPSVVCTGGAVQNPPECSDSCTADIECDTNAYCSQAGVCIPDEPNGDTCTADSQCVAGHCQNGFCCASGDCCANAGDCTAYDEAADCTEQATCQGERVDGVCNGSNQCVVASVDDDSACASVVADTCGPYPAIVCSGAINQVPPSCPTDCMGDAECDGSAHCDGGSCVPDSGPGGFCTSTTQCAGGLQCVDNVCCTSACGGGCQACDLPGSEGTCTSVPEGDDPDAECGSIDCDGYYSGWSGDDCHARADVPSNVAGCNGSGACQDDDDLCASQPQGPIVESCDATCETPLLVTCAGQNDPLCNDVNPGTNTCGQGACENTLPQCQNGAPLTCTPNIGAAGPEQCNDLDDNCDGSVDNDGFSDSFEPNGTCGSVATLAEVGSDDTLTYASQTIFSAGDEDYYYVHVEETDNSCSCCDFFCLDEDFRVWLDLTVPSGAGSYMFCVDTGCSTGGFANCTEVLAGQTGSWIYTFDGSCPGDNDYDIYIHVYGDNAPALECSPYTLSYRMEPGCF